MKTNRIRYSAGERIFEIANMIVLGAFALTAILPYLNLLAVSFSNNSAVEAGKITFWPVGFNLDNYKTVLSDLSIIKAFGVSVFTTVFGTLLSLLLTVTFAYPLSRKEFRFRKFCTAMIMVTFIFNTPLIPWFLTMKSLGFYDNFAAIILPAALSTYNIIIVRSFFAEVPQALIDSAKVDGCGEMRTLFQVILPISKAVMATVGLMYGVSYWNSYTTPLYLINNRNLFTLQLRLKALIIDSSQLETMNNLGAAVSPQALKMTTILVAAVPILCVYPFLQKHFVKGMTLGSVKG